MRYCDSCLTIAYDVVGEDGAEQDKFLSDMSGMGMIEDHLCDRVETDGEITCNCEDH